MFSFAFFPCHVIGFKEEQKGRKTAVPLGWGVAGIQAEMKDTGGGYKKVEINCLFAHSSLFLEVLLFYTVILYCRRCLACLHHLIVEKSAPL